ncbi:MAG: CHAT domain-containing protein [Bacteroidota bacterium]
MSYKEAIEKDLSKGRLEDALHKLDELITASGDDFYSGVVIQLFARFNRNKMDFDGGTKLQQDYDIENARITSSVYSQLKEVEDQEYVKKSSSGGGTNSQASGGKSTASGAADAAIGYIRILMLTSNPSDTAKLNLDREHARIHDQLQLSENYGDYELHRQRETTVLHLGQTMFKNQPHIVHFSGHGQNERVAAAIDESDPLAEVQPGQKGGLMFKQVEGHETQIVSSAQLKALFSSMVKIQKIPIKLVMLNACYAQDQAAAISEEVDYVIGTNDAILDEAAWTFSVGFYFRLVSAENTALNDDIVKQAFNMGQTNAMLMGEPMDRFKLYVRGELMA